MGVVVCLSALVRFQSIPSGRGLRTRCTSSYSAGRTMYTALGMQETNRFDTPISEFQAHAPLRSPCHTQETDEEVPSSSELNKTREAKYGVLFGERREWVGGRCGSRG